MKREKIDWGKISTAGEGKEWETKCDMTVGVLVVWKAKLKSVLPHCVLWTRHKITNCYQGNYIHCQALPPGYCYHKLVIPPSWIVAQWISGSLARTHSFWDHRSVIMMQKITTSKWNTHISFHAQTTSISLSHTRKNTHAHILVCLCIASFTLLT